MESARALKTNGRWSQAEHILVIHRQNAGKMVGFQHRSSKYVTARCTL